MNKKASTFFKVFTGILFVIAIFFHDMDQGIFLGLIAFGLIGLLLLLVMPRIHFPKIQWKHTFSRKRKEIPDSEQDPLQDALLCQFSHRITDKLRSAYPKALWNWDKQPNVQKILSGKSMRIRLSDAAEYTHAEVSLDTYGSIHLRLMKIQELSPQSGAAPSAEEPPVDCTSWYELVGASVLNQMITDLNARGYQHLSINESGEIFITDKDTPVVKERFQNFPGKKHWEELVSIFQENELQAQITDTALILSWNK